MNICRHRPCLCCGRCQLCGERWHSTDATTIAWRFVVTCLSLLFLVGCGIASTDRAHVMPGATAVAYEGALCGGAQGMLDVANSTDHEVSGRCWTRVTAPDGTVTESTIELNAVSSATASQQAAAKGVIDAIGAIGPALGQAAGEAARAAAGVP